MPVYGEAFLRTQIGRSIAVHFDAPTWERGRRRKAVVRQGLFMGVEERIVRVPGEEYPLRVEQDADQPAFATREGVWWEWTSPQLAFPPGFKDE